MGKKKLQSLSDLGGFVFSTNNDFDLSFEKTTKTLPNNKQYLEAHFSNKGRGGKTVTIIKGFIGTEEDLKKLAKLLKIKCGVGGSVKDNEIIIQGKYREKLIAILQKENYHIKRIGG